MDLKDHIRSIPDFPKPGIMFYDISTLLRHEDAWQVAMGRMAKIVRAYQPDMVAGVESRGFLIAAPLALKLGCGFIMLRKRGKLPGPTIGLDYALEYGTDRIEIWPMRSSRGSAWWWWTTCWQPGEPWPPALNCCAWSAPRFRRRRP